MGRNIEEVFSVDNAVAVLPSWVVLDPLLQSWLLEDIGRGDRKLHYTKLR